MSIWKNSAKILLAALIFILMPISAQSSLPSTFTVKQEEILASNLNVLSFLYHMTRNRASFLQMEQKFGLSKASIDKYKNFLIANKLIAPGNSEEISYLFKNPFGIWSLRMEKGPIITQTRANGLKKLSLKVEQANNNIDGDRPTYSMNTFRLTPQQFVEYKNDMATVLGKYFDLTTVNLEKKIKHQQVWSVWMSDILSLKASENDNIYFGKVKEF